MVSRVMISVRVGPASTWQCVQVWLHSLPTLTCSVSIRSARRVSCPYSASVASNERRSLAVFFSGLRRTVTLAMSAAAPVRCTGDGFARDRLARAVDDREVPAVRAGVQHIQRLRADFQRDAPTVDVMVVVLRFREGPGEEGEMALPDARRSEEHTSELQSRLHLVCRLLLEKKKINRINALSGTGVQ